MAIEDPDATTSDDLEEEASEPDPNLIRDDYLKYHFDGAASTDELAERLRAYADEVEQLASQGWSLAGPVDSGWAHFQRDEVPAGQ